MSDCNMKKINLIWIFLLIVLSSFVSADTLEYSDDFEDGVVDWT